MKESNKPSVTVSFYIENNQPRHIFRDCIKHLKLAIDIFCFNFSSWTKYWLAGEKWHYLHTYWFPRRLSHFQSATKMDFSHRRTNYGSKEAYLPLCNQTRKKHCFPRSLSPGNCKFLYSLSDHKSVFTIPTFNIVGRGYHARWHLLIRPMSSDTQTCRQCKSLREQCGVQSFAKMTKDQDEDSSLWLGH